MSKKKTDNGKLNFIDKLSSEEMIKLKNKFSDIYEIDKDEDHPFNQLKLTYEELIDIIEEVVNKNIKKRSVKEMYYLYHYLDITNFEQNVKIDLDLLNFQQFFFFASQFMTIKHYNEKDIIYYEGDQAETFYILMKGEIAFYNLKSEDKTMSSIEYYLFLYDMYLNSVDKLIMNNTIKTNKDIFPLNKYSDISNFQDIIFKFKLLNLVKEGDENNIINYITDNKKSISDINFDKVIGKEETLEEYYTDIFNSLSESEQFYFPILNDEKQKIKVFENEYNKKIQEKEYFSNFKLGTNFKRKETAKCAKDGTRVLSINKKYIYDCIKEEELKNKEKEIDNIYQSPIFNIIRKNLFESAYYNKLTKEIYSMGENIFVEGDILDNIYILIEGTVEINLVNKNIIDIKKLIQKFNEMNPILFKKEHINESIELKNPMIKLKDYLFEKKNISLFLIKTRESFGIIEFLYNNRKAVYNLKVISDKAKIFKMNIDNFILEKNGHIECMELIRRKIIDDSIEQLKENYKRLILLKNSLLCKIDCEFTQKSIEDEKKEEIIDINEAKNNMTRVNNNANISNFSKDIFFNRLTKRNFNELRKRTTLSYLNQETQPTLLITETKQLDTDYSFKKHSISNINESSSMNKFNIIEKKENDQSKEKEFNIDLYKFYNLKKKLRKDADHYYRKRNIKEVPIFPILKGSKNISNSLQNYRYKRMTPSILRNDAFKTKVSNFDLTKYFFNSYTPVRPSFDKEKKLNYLTIKQFYNGFNGQVTKYNMIKK